MSADGTIIVLVPSVGKPVESETVVSILTETGDEPKALVGINLTTALGMFADRTGWVRAGTADALTAEEAVRVAARLRKRLEATVVVPAEAGDALEAIVRRRFVEAVASGDWTGQFEATLAECAPLLTPEALQALRTAVEQGVEPLPGER